MLSAAKVRIHGMQDDNWVIKDKINQYRNLIKLYERDRQIHEGDLIKQKKRYARDIRQLRNDINVKREELGVAVYGDKQFLRNAFQEHRRLQLQYMNSQADRVLESIHQENFNRRKMLDRIRYKKKQKMEKFRRMQLEAAELRDRQLYELGGKLPAEKKEQVVANYVQKANIKKNAALAIKVMYKKILDILKKDSTYFTVVLEALKLDCRAQGKCLMGATEMGQLAMEYLDDRKYEFNVLEKEIKLNMKERDRTLKLVRMEVNYLSNSFPKLIRKEEASNLDDLYDDDAEKQSIHSVHWQLEEVMSLCKKLQRSTLVSTYEEILPGLQNQRAMGQRLMGQLQLNTLKRDNALENMKHARLMLDSLKNIGQEETSLYIREKKSLQELLAAETREKERLRKEMNIKGKRIIAMKVSLQQIVQLLSGVISPPPKEKGGAPLEPEVQELPPPQPVDPMIQSIPELESNIDKLLQIASLKLGVLATAMSKIEDTEEVRQKAHHLYHGIIARSMQDSYKEEVAAEGGLIEFEMEDASVPSHAIIKLRSKQLVDAQVSEFDVPSK